MGRGTKTTEFLKECMADALIRLMRDKPFHKISANEITDAAGVGRSTWFRNYNSKNEALTFKLVQLWDRWAAEHGLVEREQYSPANAVDFFNFNFEIRHIITAIYKAGLQSTIYDAFYQILGPKTTDDTFECYHWRFYCFGLFGILDEWVKRSFAETPAETTEIFDRVMKLH